MWGALKQFHLLHYDNIHCDQQKLTILMSIKTNHTQLKTPKGKYVYFLNRGLYIHMVNSKLSWKLLRNITDAVRNLPSTFPERIKKKTELDVM